MGLLLSVIQSINQPSTNHTFTELQLGGKHCPRCFKGNENKQFIHAMNLREVESQTQSLKHELGSEVLGCLEGGTLRTDPRDHM